MARTDIPTIEGNVVYLNGIVVAHRAPGASDILWRALEDELDQFDEEPPSQHVECEVAYTICSECGERAD